MKRCMIIDGSNVIRKVARRILSGPDMSVSEASGGHEGLAMCRAEMPDIIVVDALLDDMDTALFVSEAVAMRPDAPPHVVVSMTKLDVGAFMRAKRAGARGYLLKPFNRQQLLDGFRAMNIAA